LDTTVARFTPCCDGIDIPSELFFNVPVGSGLGDVTIYEYNGSDYCYEIVEFTGTASDFVDPLETKCGDASCPTCPSPTPTIHPPTV
jgi:hypothetical protein